MLYLVIHDESSVRHCCKCLCAAMPMVECVTCLNSYHCMYECLSRLVMLGSGLCDHAMAFLTILSGNKLLVRFDVYSTFTIITLLLSFC